MSTTTTVVASPLPAERRVVVRAIKRGREPADAEPAAVLYSAQGPDLSVQNSALFYAHEVAAAAQLEQRIAHRDAHPALQRQARDLFDALALEDDKLFFAEMCDEGYSFALRYAWLFCRFSNCDEEEVNLIFPTGRGLLEEVVDGHQHGRAGSKQDIVDSLLQRAPLPYAHRARNVLKQVQAQKRNAAPVAVAAGRW